MKLKRILICLLVLAPIVSASSLLSGCARSGAYAGRGPVYHGVGYRGYYGPAWRRPPIYIGGGGEGEVDPDWGVEAPDAPVAVPLPEMGMPEFDGGLDIDMGGFDW